MISYYHSLLRSIVHHSERPRRRSSGSSKSSRLYFGSKRRSYYAFEALEMFVHSTVTRPDRGHYQCSSYWGRRTQLPLPNAGIIPISGPNPWTPYTRSLVVGGANGGHDLGCQLIPWMFGTSWSNKTLDYYTVRRTSCSKQVIPHILHTLPVMRLVFRAALSMRA